MFTQTAKWWQRLSPSIMLTSSHARHFHCQAAMTRQDADPQEALPLMDSADHAPTLSTLNEYTDIPLAPGAHHPPK